MVVNLKDIIRKRIKITREEQKKLGVNEEIKQAIRKESTEGETHAETISRVLKTNHQMTDLLVTLVKNMEETPSKMVDLLLVLPVSLKNLLDAIVNVRESEK